MSKQNESVKTRNRSRNWEAIARGRAQIPNRQIVNGSGLSNVPKVTDTGSAAYRRLIAGKGKRH